MKKKTTAGERIAFTVYSIDDAKDKRKRKELASRIDRAVASAVKAERARCVGVVEEVKSGNTTTPFAAFVCDDIIKKMKGG